ncbi:MAG: hypothetical protein MUC73_14025 [Cyclobacteriaceae bacterium]|jgi:hypothetical protein|nr:hypothetical protein [Cyclobacteriaceae bacterium]
MGCKNVIITLFLFLAVLTLRAQQPRLAVIKGDKRITYFKEGDLIRFKRSDRDHFTKGFIGGLTQDYLRIQDDTTFISQIEKIDLSGGENTGFKTRIIGGTFILAGSLLFVGDLINETVVNDNEYKADAAVITVSAVLISTGVIMQFVNNDIFKIGRRKRIVVLQE